VASRLPSSSSGRAFSTASAHRERESWAMPVHRIELEIPVNAIVSADTPFIVYGDNEKLAQLTESGE
jgi:hypothetical protein